MNILNISKEDLFHYLTNNNCIGQGCIGRISIYDENTLIKIYYKELIDTYISKDFNYLDEEIDIKISVKEELLDDNILPNQKEIDDLIQKKYELLYQEGLLKGLVYYRGILVGILMNYYKDYITLTEIFNTLDSNTKILLLNKAKEKLKHFINNNLYPMDLKEDNILVNPITLDIAFIDLDDSYTRYEEREYIIEHKLFHLENTCVDRYESMEKRLNKK